MSEFGLEIPFYTKYVNIKPFIIDFLVINSELIKIMLKASRNTPIDRETVNNIIYIVWYIFHKI